MPSWTGAENLASTGIRSPDRPAHSESVYRLSYTITGLDKPRWFQEVEAPVIFRHSSYEGGKLVSPTYRPYSLPREGPWYSFLLEAESTLGP